jgi:4-aminobutyrate aminotransferase-like enzyme
MVFGKGVTSSYLPLGGLAVTEKIAGQIDSWPEQGTHMFTHANHPLVCASAIANIQVLIEENMVQNSERMGTYLLDRLNELSVENEHIDGIRGKGLFVGAEIVKSKHTREEDQDLGHRVAERAREKGLLFVLSQLRMANATIAIFSPPLSISSDQIDEGLEIFRSALKETSA